VDLLVGPKMAENAESGEEMPLLKQAMHQVRHNLPMEWRNSQVLLCTKVVLQAEFRELHQFLSDKKSTLEK